METTVGQLMVNKALPADMRDHDRVLDKKGLKSLLRELAEKHPDQYREVSHALSRIGFQGAYTTGGNSFGLSHLRRSATTTAAQRKLQTVIDQILDRDDLDDDKRDEQIVLALGREGGKQAKRIYEESLAEENPLGYQVLSGSRGNPTQLASLRGSDLLYADHRDRVLPIPVMRSYSQGLRPVEYWAGAYGARKGVIDTKFATQDAGFLSKQLNQIVHRALVTKLDADNKGKTLTGLPVDVEDTESEGALLAHATGGFRRNTIITPKILQDLKRQGIKRLLVRSPAVSGSPDGGVYARDVGVREFGGLAEVGQNVGMAAAQALSEPLSQAQLSSKHSGGVAGATAGAVSGFDYINQLIQVPRTFKGGAAHADIDGLVTRIEEAPAGGNYVWIDDTRHYVGKDFDTVVKRGDHVEAGDVISEGIPNPSTIVQHKGVGEGRRYFVNAFRQAFRDAGITGHRRNIELLARGLINHVRLTEEMGDYIPDDIVTYGELEAAYQPRQGHETREPRGATGMYLEQPYLHYSIGTKIRPSMMQDFDDFGVKKIAVHSEPPPFQPEMVRGMANLQHDPDWITRMFGSGLKKSLLHGTQMGATSNPRGTSFVPGLAAGTEFGTSGQVVTPQRSLQKRSEAPSSRTEETLPSDTQITQQDIDEMMANLRHHTPEEHERSPGIYDFIADTGDAYLDATHTPRWFGDPASWIAAGPARLTAQGIGEAENFTRERLTNWTGRPGHWLSPEEAARRRGQATTPSSIDDVSLLRWLMAAEQATDAFEQRQRAAQERLPIPQIPGPPSWFDIPRFRPVETAQDLVDRWSTDLHANTTGHELPQVPRDARVPVPHLHPDDHEKLVEELGYDPIAVLQHYNDNMHDAGMRDTSSAMRAIHALMDKQLIVIPEDIRQQALPTHLKDETIARNARLDYLEENLPGVELPAEIERAVSAGTLHPDDAIADHFLRMSIDREVVDGRMDANQAIREKTRLAQHLGYSDTPLVPGEADLHDASTRFGSTLFESPEDAQAHYDQYGADEDRQYFVAELQRYVDELRASGHDPSQLKEDPEAWSAITNAGYAMGLSPEEVGELLTDAAPETYWMDEYFTTPETPETPAGFIRGSHEPMMMEPGQADRDLIAGDTPGQPPQTQPPQTQPPQTQPSLADQRQPAQTSAPLTQSQITSALGQIEQQPLPDMSGNLGLSIAGAFPEVTNQVLGAMGPVGLMGIGMLTAPQETKRLFGHIGNQQQPVQQQPTPQPQAAPPQDDNPFGPPPTPAAPQAGGVGGGGIGGSATPQTPRLPRPTAPTMPGPGAGPRPSAVPTGVPGS